MHLQKGRLCKGPKILATMGPSSCDTDIVKDMIRSGVSGFRINMSFGNPKLWDSHVGILRDAASELDAVIPVIGDIPGPQTRSGNFEPIKVKKGDILTFTTALNATIDKGEVPVSRREFLSILELGDTVLYGDGDVEFRVLDVGEDYAKCIAVSPGMLEPGKKVVVPGKEIPLPFLDGNQIPLVRYVCEKGFTYIALSYVRNSQDVLFVRGLLDQYGCSDIGVISKIETPSGLRNSKEISKVSDAILVARGDLGVHFPIETVPILQDQIIRLATSLGKPVIIATDILESMIEGNRPSRSDVVGIYNIVYSLADAILLTNETAIGKHPVEVTKWARVIADTAFDNTPAVLADQLRRAMKPQSLLEKYVHGLISLAESLGGPVLVYTKTGRTIPLISKLRPRVPVLVGSWNRRLLEKYTIYYNIHPIDVSVHVSESDDYEKGVQELFSKARNKGYLKPGEVVIKSYAKPGLNVHEIRVEVVV